VQIETVQPQDWLEIGTIVAPQGLKGEVRVYSESDFPERFETPGQRWLQRPGIPDPKAIHLLEGRFLNGKGLYVVKFAEISDRAQAEALRGARLLVPQGDRPLLQPGEFYIQDLIGLAVFLQPGQALIGEIVGIANAGNDLLEIKLTACPEQTVLVPLVKEIVPLVDLANRRVEINPPPGLLPKLEPLTAESEAVGLWPGSGQG
jgi:16S rRNA processing protein RimM